MSVSVVILTWNRKNDLRDMLESVKNQSLAADECVVVDNGSRDGTPEMVESDYPWARLIRLARNMGVEGWNIGIANARSDFAAVFDDDVTLPPDWIKNCMDVFAQAPEDAAVVSPKVKEPGMPEDYLCDPEYNSRRYVCTFAGNGFIAKRRALIDAGLYRRELFLYGNERDLAARLLNRGRRILHCPEALTLHKRAWPIRLSPFALRYTVRNYLIYLALYYSWGNLARLAAGVFARGAGKRNLPHSGFDSLKKSLLIAANWPAIAGGAVAFLFWIPYCAKHREVCRHPDFEPLL
ncbi:MAG: glycosyltransferase family 2 protein [Elusimicrobiota bacterium]